MMPRRVVIFPDTKALEEQQGLSDCDRLSFVQFAGQPAGGADDDITGCGGAIDCAKHLRVAWHSGVVRRRRLRGEPARLGGPDGRRAPPRHRLTKRSETNLRIGDKRQGAVLYGIVSRDIQLDQPKFRIAKQSARSVRVMSSPLICGRCSAPMLAYIGSASPVIVFDGLRRFPGTTATTT